MSPPRVVLRGAGLVTSVGHDVEETYASARCGVSRARRSGVVGPAGFVFAAPVLPLDAGPIGAARAMALVEPALERALGALRPSTIEGLRVGLVACTTDFSPAIELGKHPARAEAVVRLIAAYEPLVPAMGQALAARGAIVDRTHRVVYGSSSALLGLLYGERWLAEGLDLVVVIAHGCLVERPWLEALAVLGRTRSEQRRDLPLASEAAAVLVLGARGPGPRIGGVGSLRGGRDGERTLAAAIDRALTRWGGDPLTLRELLTDLNGLRDRAWQMGVATLRALGPKGVAPPSWTPAESLGEVDAAIGGALIALGAVAANEQGGPVLVLGSGRSASRSAAVVMPDPGDEEETA